MNDITAVIKEERDRLWNELQAAVAVIQNQQRDLARLQTVEQAARVYLAATRHDVLETIDTTKSQYDAFVELDKALISADMQKKSGKE
jgi:hypothetical protein